MATVLRPPLVFRPQQKRWVGTPDVYPNLLATTLRLAGTVPLPLSALKCLDSAPRVKFRPQVDAYPNLLVTTFYIPPDTTNVPIVQLYGSAPARVGRLSVDLYPNLLTSTLGVLSALNLPLRALKQDASAPPAKRPVVAQQLDVRATWRDPVPGFITEDSSAPVSRVRTQVDTYPNLNLTTLAAPPATFTLPLSALRWDASAPPPKRPVFAHQLDVRAVWRDPVPLFLRMDGGAPVSRVRVQVDCYPNLNVTTLAPPPATFALPLSALKLDASAALPKRSGIVDCYPNLSLTLGGGTTPVSLTSPFESSIFSSRVLH